MNKLVVLTKNTETYFIKRLIQEVGEEIKFFNPWKDFELPEAQTYLVRTSGVYGNDLDLLFIKTLPPERVINSLESLTRFRSKASQYTWFDEKDFPSLHWLPLKGTDDITLERFFRLYPEVVVKPLIGQGGWGIEVLTWERFKSWWKKRKGKDESFLIQPFIREARELRYFFIKNHPDIVLERTARTGVTANFKKAGEAKLASLPLEFQPIIDRLVQESKATYGAIDLLIDEQRLIILELNTVPGIEQLEQVSGENVMRKLVANFSCQIS